MMTSPGQIENSTSVCPDAEMLLEFQQHNLDHATQNPVSATMYQHAADEFKSALNRHLMECPQCEAAIDAQQGRVA